jgi:hypothetical protein
MTATKHDNGKLRYDLIPPEAMQGLAQALTYGATKYGDRNWEGGLNPGRVFAALQRHLWAWHGGEKTDPESGLSHLDHVLVNAAFLKAYEARSVPVYNLTLSDAELDELCTNLKPGTVRSRYYPTPFRRPPRPHRANDLRMSFESFADPMDDHAS